MTVRSPIVFATKDEAFGYIMCTVRRLPIRFTVGTGGTIGGRSPVLSRRLPIRFTVSTGGTISFCLVLSVFERSLFSDRNGVLADYGI